MRVAGTRCDAEPAATPEGLRFVLREWIGDTDTGQLGYFRKKALERIRKNRTTERLAKLSLLASVIVIASMVVAGSFMSAELRNGLMIGMGGVLLLFGIRQAYAHSTAEKELIKQYEFMLRIFHNARRRLGHAADPAEQRQILRALGGSALDEHAEWILMHRDRSLDQGEIWRMGS
jgi:nitrate/nitrite-specific signal transduction histidine kinase